MKIKRSEFIEKWLEALESGEYKQGKNYLRLSLNGEPEYCCLGVACDVANKLSLRVDYFDISDNKRLPESLANFIGVSRIGHFKELVRHRGEEHYSLTSLNDAGVRFKTIARIIREQLAKKNFGKA